MSLPARLRRHDAEARRLSLAPDRLLATPLEALADLAFAAEEQAARVTLLADLADRFADDYPDNQFCDLDAIAGRLAVGTAEEAAAFATAVARLSYHYGRHTTLRFRYVHDFLYGLDWCRWASKDPDARAAVAPLSDAFLGYLARRGNELTELIAAGDTKYHPLPPGAYRNPFPFDRSPEREAVMLRTLATTGLMPFDAWSQTGAYRLTDVVAQRLSLATAEARAVPDGQP